MPGWTSVDSFEGDSPYSVEFPLFCVLVVLGHGCFCCSADGFYLHFLFTGDLLDYRASMLDIDKILVSYYFNLTVKLMHK